MAEDVKKHGVKTVVDATTNEFGRSPDILKRYRKKAALMLSAPADITTKPTARHGISTP
jgi:predicted metal-dependent phosphotriesterase family hydrolase